MGDPLRLQRTGVRGQRQASARPDIQVIGRRSCPRLRSLRRSSTRSALNLMANLSSRSRQLGEIRGTPRPLAQDPVFYLVDQ